MHTYRFCGDAFTSETPFPELTGSTGGSSATEAPAWTFVPGSVPPSGRPIHEWSNRDQPGAWLRISRCHGGYHLQFTIGLECSLIGRDIVWAADPSLPPHTVRHLLLDQVFPLALSGQGDLVLHGSAVLVDGRAVLFVGESGRGKSTLAAWMGGRGHAVLADDCLRMDESSGRLAMRPAYPGLRVWPDAARYLFGARAAEMGAVAHYAGKLRVGALPPAAGTVLVARVYLLQEAAGPEPLVRATGAGSVIDLLRCTFRLDIEDRQRLADDFVRVSDLVDSGAVRYLHVPWSLDRLADVERAIAADLETTRDAGAAGACA